MRYEIVVKIVIINDINPAARNKKESLITILSNASAVFGLIILPPFNFSSIDIPYND